MLTLNSDGADALALKVFDMLTSQSFVNWYENEFMDFVTGEEDCPTEEDIKARIARFVK